MKPRMYLIIITWRTWIKQTTTITCEERMVNDLVTSLVNLDMEEIVVVEKKQETPKDGEKNND